MLSFYQPLTVSPAAQHLPLIFDQLSGGPVLTTSTRFDPSLHRYIRLCSDVAMPPGSLITDEFRGNPFLFFTRHLKIQNAVKEFK